MRKTLGILLLFKVQFSILGGMVDFILRRTNEETRSLPLLPPLNSHYSFECLMVKAGDLHSIL